MTMSASLKIVALSVKPRINIKGSIKRTRGAIANMTPISLGAYPTSLRIFGKKIIYIPTIEK